LIIIQSEKCFDAYSQLNTTSLVGKACSITQKRLGDIGVNAY